MSRLTRIQRTSLGIAIAMASIIVPTTVAEADRVPIDPGDTIDETSPTRLDKPTAIVAFGDSFISGEGAGSYKPVVDADGVQRVFQSWTEPNSSAFYCHRSAKAFVEVAALPGIDKRFNLACSGAIGPDASTSPIGRPGARNISSQLDQLRSISGSHDIEVVVIGFGANNSAFTFGHVAFECASYFAFDAYTLDESALAGHAVRIGNLFFKKYLKLDNLKGLRDAWKRTYRCNYDDLQQYEQAISQETLRAAREIITEVRKTEGDDFKVIMQGYTSPLTDNFDGSFANYARQSEANKRFKKLYGVRFDSGCPVHADALKLAGRYTEFLSQNAASARDVLASEFPDIDLVYLDVQDALDDNRVCDPGQFGSRGRLVTPLLIRDRKTGDRITHDRSWGLTEIGELGGECATYYQLCQESLHPNAAGHRILGRCLSKAVRGSAELVSCRRNPTSKRLSFDRYRRYVDFNSSITVSADGSETVVDIGFSFDQSDRNLSRGVTVTADQARAVLPSPSSSMSGSLQVRLPCTLRGGTTHLDVDAWALMYGMVHEFSRPYDVQVAPCPIAPPSPDQQVPPVNAADILPGGPAAP